MLIRTMAIVGVSSVLFGHAAECQVKRYPLSTTADLRLHSAAAEVETFKGKRGVRLSVSPEIQHRPDYLAGNVEPEAFAIIKGLEFADGIIEAEVAGSLDSTAAASARGFVGIAWRLQADRDSAGPQTYDAFYLRPTNGRADDQERRNHAVQYISHPEWTWSRLRRETPSRYEAYVDLVPDTWTKIRIEVRGAQARLYVHGQTQPTLIVNDVKSGATGKGAIALWIGPGTVAHFRNLVVTR